MSDIILPSKLVSERITVSFDFRDELGWGETITGHNFSVEVVSGIDTTPQELLYKTSVAVNTVVSQQIYQGLPGVLYRIACTVAGSSGKFYIKTTQLAILPDIARIPPIDARWFTSRVYPIESIDSIGDSGSLQDSLFLTISIDSFHDVGEILAGEMFEILETYTIPPEYISDAGAIILADLYEGLVTYTIPPESLSDAGLLVSATLETVLITYSNYAPESISDAGAIISGELL